jgi:hypothetical protein
MDGTHNVAVSDADAEDRGKYYPGPPRDPFTANCVAWPGPSPSLVLYF